MSQGKQHNTIIQIDGAHLLQLLHTILVVPSQRIDEDIKHCTSDQEVKILPIHLISFAHSVSTSQDA